MSNLTSQKQVKIRIAVFSDISPLRDYIYTTFVPDGQTPEDVINSINKALINAHCELVSVLTENQTILKRKKC